MKHLISILFFVLIGVAAFSQQPSTKSKAAQKAYANAQNAMLQNDYKGAVELYKEAILKDKYYVEAYWQLAELYKTMNNEQLRMSTLKRAAHKSFPNVNHTYVKLGTAQYENGLYKEALESFSEVPVTEKTHKIAQWLEKCKVAIELKSKPVPFDPKNLGSLLNTEFDDYWPSITADEQMLSMTVLYGRQPGTKANIGVHEEIYHSKKVNNKWTKSENIGAPMNTSGNEGAQTFSFDGRYMFFVACDRRTGLGGCDIYYSIRNGDTWSEPINPGEPLNSKYWETTPSFSSAGNELFFSSNRPGGKGKKDIWKCSVKIGEDGKLVFSNPENIGEPINTDEDEFSPFIHADNKTLYFSSTGHYGLGGYDVFLSRRTDGKWEEPKNLGYPLNTHRDEIGFIVNTSGQKAYFSSDGIEKNGRGKDIYEVSLYDEIKPDPVKVLKGKIFDYDEKEPIQAHVELYRLRDDEVVYESVSDRETGEFVVGLPADEEYGFNVNKRDYLFFSGHFDKDDEEETEIDIELPRIEAGRSLILKNVFFDFDLYDLKPESKAELDRLYSFLRQNHKVKLELAGHTDSKGGHDYNVTLSTNRAKAVYDYLVKKGIKPDRLTYKGYGPDKPLATNDTDEGRALNRRTEAIITAK